MIDDIRVSTGFTGDDTNRFSHTIASDGAVFTNNGGSAIVISNNVDYIHYFEGHSGDRFVSLDLSAGAGGFTDFAHAKEVVEFWNHFFTINFNNGATNVRSIAYADLGEITDWIGGTSGSATLTDTRGKLLRAKKLGADMIIYSENSITTCRYLGGTVLFIFPTLVYETGLFSEKALWDFVNVHYLIGTDQKLYGYAGGQQLIQIGNPIEDSMFEAMDISNKENSLLGLDPANHKVYFLFPTSSDEYAKKAYVYNYKRNPPTWEYYEFNNSIRDFSVFSNTAKWYADGEELKGTYADETTFYADASYTQEGYPTAVVISADGYIYQLDKKLGLDDDASIRFTYETMDITVDGEEHFFRTAWVSFNLMSSKDNSTVDLSYSTDGGVTWTVFELDYYISNTTYIKNKWYQHRFSIDVNDRKIRFKIDQDSNKDVQIRIGHIKLEPQTDRD